MHKNQGTDPSCKLREFLASENLGPEHRETLLELIDAYIDQADEVELDADLMDAGLAKLRELGPEPPHFDKEAGLASLLDAMDQREAKRAGRMRRAGRIVGIAAACVAVLMVVANAFGVNPIQYAHEFAETVSFWLTPSGEMVLPPESKSEYASLQEALDADGVDVAIPTWIPEGFQINSVKTIEVQNTKGYIAVFSTDGKELKMHVSIGAVSAMRTDEKEAGGYDYKHSGEIYYIISNTDSVKALMANEMITLMISGNISEKEMEKIIDSIR